MDLLKSTLKHKEIPLVCLSLFLAGSASNLGALVLSGVISLYFLKKNDLIENIVLLIILMVFSDSTLEPLNFAKNAKILVLLFIALGYYRQVLNSTYLKSVYILIPFIFWSALTPILVSTGHNIQFLSIQKSISYGILFVMLVPLIGEFKPEELKKFSFKVVLLSVLISFINIVLYHWDPLKASVVQDRMNGVFRNPNGAAMFTALAIPITHLVFKIYKEDYSKNSQALCFFILFYALWLTQSRNAQAAVFLYFICYYVSQKSKRAGLLLIAFFGFLNVDLIPRISSMLVDFGFGKYFRLDETLGSASGRFYVWEAAMAEINSNFFYLGPGLAYSEEVNWIANYYYEFPDLIYHFGNIHNSFLTIWMNTGLIGLILFVIGFVGFFYKHSFIVELSLAFFLLVVFLGSFESWLAGTLNPFTIFVVVFFAISMKLKKGFTK